AAWRRAEAAALGATLAGAAALAAVLAFGPIAGAGLRLDTVGGVVALLVGFVGWVIVRYSHRYLQGESNERRYLRLLALTLAAVSLVLAADHLLLLAAAWIGTSLTLHRLLRFYVERPAARLAAHKKFLSARAADAALLAAVALLGTAYGTLSLDAMLAAAAVEGVPPLAQAGLVLLVVTALLKCAQLPLHGWLIQVMEAPTPVSALLHAGVVNLGGFVLIRFAPMLAEAPVALVLLAAVATATVVAATLVMGTRISIKVALAWSTVAQMGFMLLQIALGLPAMALLHLVAHSLYKAHAFLAAGGVVQRQQALRLAPAVAPSAARWALAALVVPAAVVAAGLAAGALATPAAALAGAVLGLALVPLAAAGRFVAAAGVALGWFAGHAVASWVVVPASFGVPLALVAVVAAALLAMFALQAAVALRPGAGVVRRLYPWAYGGFYVDERVSRALLERWPVPAAPVPAPPLSSTLAGAR
ncbi:NADH-quinone oxidoreductase subunit L, partial [Azohydromonas sediminis]|uniref:NADH-quinone oxidoreductase subunit L n=1 Tax=Azohydromonas sediminis TaxID=2259674 RepID=UPI000E65C505